METSHSGAEDRTLEFTAHDQPISRCQFLDHDRLIVTASHDSTIAFWEASSGSKLHTLQGHTHRVVSISLDETNKTLLSASWDKSVAFWDTNTSEKVWSGLHDSIVTTCHTVPEHHLAITGCDNGSYYYWDTRTGQRLTSINAHSNTVTCCRFSPNGIDLCTCSMDNTSLIWDIRTHKQLLKLTGHVNVVSGCAFSPNSHYLATCSWDKTVRVYDVTSGGYRDKGPVVLKDHVGCASACNFSKDGTMLVSCGYDHDINIWNTSNFQLKNTFRGHEGWIEDVDFGESSDWLISCGKDGNVHVWHTDVKLHHYNKKKKAGLDIVTCAKCGRTFSPVGDCEAGKRKKSSIASTPTEKQTTTNSKTNSSSEESPNTNQSKVISAARQGQNVNGSEEKNKDDCVWLCVFCRLNDPSRSLEQRSGQYLNEKHYNT